MTQESVSPPFDVWSHKPWWCQPWTIALTGISIICGSWLLLHRWWLTGAIALPIGAWMGFFVLLYPRLMAEYYAQNDREFSASESQED
ncbi:MAG: DUF6737 family protein [Cyanobacteria bacterium P01_E01_bin.48]